MTADITFNMSKKKIIPTYHKPHILTEAALVAWIADHSQTVLGEITVTAKALSLHDTFTEKAINDNHNGNEYNIKNLQPDNSVCMQRKKRPNWFMISIHFFAYRGQF